MGIFFHASSQLVLFKLYPNRLPSHLIRSLVALTICTSFAVLDKLRSPRIDDVDDDGTLIAGGGGRGARP